MLRISIAVVALLLHVGLASPGCISETCAGCLSDSNCGWCEQSQTCLEGSFSGVASCPTASWFWESCPDVACSNFTSCASCNNNDNCGWCASTNTCLAGTVVAPRTAVCLDWQFTGCPGVAPEAVTFVDDSQASLSIRFSLDMRQRAPGTPCSSYIATALGTGAQCVWISPRVFSVQLGSGLSSVELALDLSPGVTGGLWQSLDGVAPSTAVLAPATAAQNPQPPVVLLSGPSSVALCASGYVVSSASSVGLSLVSASPVSWSASPATPALTAAIAAAAGGSTLSVGSVDLTGGVVYTIEATIDGVTASHMLELDTTADRVRVAITSPSSLTLNAWSNVLLIAQVDPCAGAAGEGVYSYAWTKVSGPLVDLSRAAQVTNTYRLPPNTLTAGVYEFEVAVSLNDSLASVGRASVMLTVERSALVALPQRMQVDTRLRDVIINGADSQDADNSSDVATYAWQCREVAQPLRECVVASVLADPAATNAGLVNFPSANLAPGPWQFTLIFSKGAQKARAFQTVMMDWDEAPSGRLQLLDAASLQVPAVGSPALNAPLTVNSAQPLVLFASSVRVSGAAQMRSWRWSVPSGVLTVDDSTTTGSTGAYLMVPANTLTPGAGYTFTAEATDTLNQTSTLRVAVVANTVPRAPTLGCAFQGNVPAEINTLTTELTVTCQGFRDDGNHYPLGYFFRADSSDSFHLNTGYASGSSFSFVVGDPSTRGVMVSVSDALGAWSTVSVPFPATATVVSTFPSTVAGVLSVATSTVVPLFDRAVQVGQVETIDQMGQGIMLALTQSFDPAPDASQLADLQAQWLHVAQALDKYVVVQPSENWVINEGTKMATWTRSASVLAPVQQNFTLFAMRRTFALRSPGTARGGALWATAFDQVVFGMQQNELNVNISHVVSNEWLDLAVSYLGAQVAQGAAVPQATTTVRHEGQVLTLTARHDTFGTLFTPLGPASWIHSTLPYTFNVSLAGRQHYVTLSEEAARQLSEASPEGHAKQAFASSYDVFRWASSPMLQLASDVVMFRFGDARASNEALPLDAPLNVSLQLTVDGTMPPNGTQLVCANWDEPLQLWVNGNCSTGPLENGVLTCSCRNGGIFAAVFAPIIPDGPAISPLVPVGDEPGFVVPWLPIVAALVLLALIGALLLLYSCYKVVAPPRSVPLSHQEAMPDAQDEDWSAHLDRPVRYHQPGAMPADVNVVYFEPTSSGDDDWPSHDQPDMDRVNPPLLPRAARAPFVGGRVNLISDGSLPADAEGVMVAPAGNPIEQERAALPRSNEVRRFDHQLGRDMNSSEEYSSSDAKKLN